MVKKYKKISFRTNGVFVPCCFTIDDGNYVTHIYPPKKFNVKYLQKWSDDFMKEYKLEGKIIFKKLKRGIKYEYKEKT